MVYIPHAKISIYLLFSSICWASVASNPFLRPGSNRPPPQVNPPPPPPKPVVDPAFAKEVEFRGYFLLKGIHHFCIFNKKANYGEWIKLNEKTYEEFQAQAFDLQAETITLAFNGQNFTLTLEQSKSSPSMPNNSTSLPKVNLSDGSSAAKNPKVMPPRPKSAPQLPAWLANRVSSRSSVYSAGSRGSSSRSRSVSPGNLPVNSSQSSGSTGLPRPGFSSSRNFSSFSPNSANGGTITDASNPSNNVLPGNSTPSVQSSELFNPQPDEQQKDQNIIDDDQSELDDLPPPPPPPNILPPSPPPDILPSLDE